MVERPPAGLDPASAGGDGEQLTPRQRPEGSGGAPTEAAPREAAHPDPQGPTPQGDIERDRARAALKARLFQIESEPVTIGRYTILSRLGQGGMGIVYSAYDEDLDRKVAVKVVLPQGGADRSHERMRREAQAMARLTHPNIVGVHEVGEVDGQVFIAMEFVRGRSLDAWSRENTPAWSEVLQVYRLAGRGLSAAHRAGLVHRDFKPHNVMLGDDGSVKVLDFGLARDERRREPSAAEPETSETSEASEAGRDGPLTATGAIVGTPAFMAPEQHLGQPATARSDQYSFCVALHLALHGEHPFAGDSLPELVASVLDGRVRERPAGDPVPGWVHRVVDRGMSRQPEDRFESMDALLDALARDPGARRRRRLAGLAGVALVFAGGFGLARIGGEPASAIAPCPDGREALAGVWDDDRRAALEAALLASDSSRAEATWSRVASRLDAHAERWREVHRGLCEAQRDGSRSDLLVERGRACLQRGRVALDELASALEQPDASTIDQAVTAAAGLPDPGRCEDVEVLLAELVPPRDEIAADVAEQRERLARARVLEDAGRIDQSVAIADEVLARAEALDYPPLRAEALLRRGTARLWSGQGASADEDLGAASMLAIEIDHEVVAAEAAARRVYVRSELLGRPADAALELPWAEALSERGASRGRDDGLRALMLNNAGAVWLRSGDGERALVSMERALEVKRASLPADHPDIALGLANVGRMERDLGRTTRALETLRMAAASIDEVLGPRHPHRALVATIAGDAALELGRYAEAEAELALADEIYREALGDAAMPRYHVLRAQGELALRRRRWDDAQSRFEAALALAEPVVGSEHPMLAEARFGLAQVVLAQGDVEAALDRTRSAAERLEAALGPAHPNVAQGWVLLGRRQLEAGRPEEARASFDRARRAKLEADRVDPAGVAWTECWLGRAWLASAELDRAEPLLTGCLEALPEQEPRRLEAMLALATLHEGRGNGAEAARWLGRAEAGLAALRPDDDPMLAWVRLRLARARHDATGGGEERARALGRARSLHAILIADPGWSKEASEAAEWLERASTPGSP